MGPLPNIIFMAYKWGVILTTYDTWGDPPSKTPWKIPWCRVSTPTPGPQWPEHAWQEKCLCSESPENGTHEAADCTRNMLRYVPWNLRTSLKFYSFLIQKKTTSRWFWGSLIVAETICGSQVVMMSLPYPNPTELEIHANPSSQNWGTEPNPTQPTRLLVVK